MKILLVTKSFTKGGSASGAVNLATALETVGATVVKVDALANLSLQQRIIRTIERICERIFFDSETHCIKIGKATIDLDALIQEHQPDVIQICDVSGNTVSFDQLNRITHPVFHRMSDFWPYHGARHYSTTPNIRKNLADILLQKLIFAKLSKRHTRVAPSQWLADCLSTKICEGEIEMIRNAVSIPPNPLPLTGKGLQFGFISGHIDDPRKGFRNLSPFLEGLGTPVTVHLFGNPPRKELPNLSNVTWIAHGRFSRSALETVFSKFDILICPSKKDNSPNVVCEAMAFGRPVIAQSGTGMDSYVTEQTGALLDFTKADSGSINVFNVAVFEIQHKIEEYSSAAVELVKAEFTPEIIGSRYHDLYTSALNERREKWETPDATTRTFLS